MEKKEIKKKRLFNSKFIKENISKKTKVLFIIGLIIFIIAMIVISSSDIKLFKISEKEQIVSYKEVINQKAIILSLILLAGLVPYFYIPIIIYIPYILMLIGDIIYYVEINGKFKAIAFNFFFYIIDIFVTSVIVALGTHLCSTTTKKYKYAQRSSFSMLDIKQQFYEIKKNEQKVNEILEKKAKKEAKMKENDIKINYIEIVKIAVVAVIMNILMTTIIYIIN
ncbi:MAG: hypothetical protein PHR25_03215 [Clostridia bacterium]|nr:hypothetical protein [Clostridia bacterium]MDD4375770.1 hypothetical protein [Clostridia bacterium]